MNDRLRDPSSNPSENVTISDIKTPLTSANCKNVTKIPFQNDRFDIIEIV